MYIYGSFINRNGGTCTVYILTNDSRAEMVEIGGDDARLYFAEDPCEIAGEVNDTFDVLLHRSATVRLLARDYMPDFFCPSWKM